EGKIITMSDALSRAMPKKLDADICNCLSHARRKFVELMDMNISVRESKHMLKWLSVIYHNDARAKEKNLTNQERLEYHQNLSAKSVKRILKWCSKIQREKKEEPNSGLGGAISYMLNHWKELVRFMSVAGAPIDNNICERAIKSSIRHRKNSLFYKTQHGALVVVTHALWKDTENGYFFFSSASMSIRLSLRLPSTPSIISFGTLQSLK
ncbi:MAG: transposase, partial [Bacteriovoracaceae bacterium]|nr:transposase [Bacteriovoracaceae bacterium]